MHSRQKWWKQMILYFIGLKTIFVRVYSNNNVNVQSLFQVHSYSMAAPLPKDLHKTESGLLYRLHLALQLRPADPHCSGRLGRIWVRPKPGHMHHQPRQERAQLKNRSLRHGFRLALRHHRRLLPQDLPGGPPVPQADAEAQLRSGHEKKRDARHENGVFDILVFYSVLLADYCC